jgi:hypothetical protein
VVGLAIVPVSEARRLLLQRGGAGPAGHKDAAANRATT